MKSKEKKLINIILSVIFLLSACSEKSEISNKEAVDVRSSNYELLRRELEKSNSYKTGENLILSDKEKALDKRFKTLVNTYEKYTNDFEFAPANPFYQFIDGEGADDIKETPLYRLIRKMPKGGNLHLHTTATFAATDFYNFVIAQDNIYIALFEGKDNEGNDVHEGSLRIYEETKEMPDMFLPLKEAVESKKITKERLISLWTIDKADNSVPHIWDEFNKIFLRVGTVSAQDKTLYGNFYKHAFLELLEDNVNHIELRTGITEFDGDTTGEIAVRILRDNYYDLKKEYPNFTLKLIITKSKRSSSDPASVMNGINNMLELKEKIKDESNPNNPVDFIVGFDLVNSEDDGHQLKAYSKYISQLKDEGKDFDLFFHAGESNLPESKNLIDAYLLGTKRIGHGLNLYKFPDLMEKFKEKQIALEVCPISNQLLRYCYDLRNHPSVEYLKRDIPIVICSDDPLVFNSKGLSFDFFEAVAGWHLGVKQIKQICINSIKYSATTDEEKDKMMSIWESDWNKFVDENYQTLDSDSKNWR